MPKKKTRPKKYYKAKDDFKQLEDKAGVEFPKDWLPLFEWQYKWHYAKQKQFIDALRDYWEVLFVAGNGTGKTHVLYWNLICYLIGIHPHQDLKVMRPPLVAKVLVIDFEHGLDNIFVETCLREQFMPDGTSIGPMLPQSMIKRLWSKEDRTLELNNGSYFVFQTSEQKKKLHSGTNFDILACDEEAEFQIYDESKRGLRTAKGGGRILHSFTPPFDEESKQRGPTWTKFKLVDPFEKNEVDDVFVVRAAMADNPAIDDSYIKRFSRGKTEEQIRIQLYGEYPTFGKMCFPEYSDSIWNDQQKVGNLVPHDTEVPDFFDPDVLFEFALDWHPSKPLAAIWTYEYLTGPQKGNVYVYDEISPQDAKGWTIRDAAYHIRTYEDWTRARIIRYCDPKMRDTNNADVTGFSPFKKFRHEGISFKDGYNRHPEVGYSIINDYLRGQSESNPKHPRLYIFETCNNLRNMLKNHYWRKKGEMGDAVPDPTFSDYPVCLKYIMQTKKKKAPRQGRSYRTQRWGLTSFDEEEFAPYKRKRINRGTVRSF